MSAAYGTANGALFAKCADCTASTPKPDNMPWVKRAIPLQRIPDLPLRGESTIEQLNDEGFGVARSDGREIWVLGAFPGERLQWRQTRVVNGNVIAEIVTLIAPSPERVPLPAAEVAICMGCPLAGLDYAAQLRLKERRVRERLSSLGTGLVILPIHPAEPRLGYRSAAKLSVGVTKGRPRVGLYEWGTRFVGNTTRCPTHHPLVNAVAKATEEEINRILQKTPASSPSIQGLRHVIVRVSPGTDKVMITLVMRQDDERLLKTLGKGLQRRVSTLVSLHANINPREGAQVFGRDTRLLWGHRDLLDKVGPHRILLSPLSFFQAHHVQASWIYALVREWARLTPADSALDLYSGVGGIAMSLAEDGGRVIGIEIFEAAARDARRNAELNNLRNCRFRAADAEDLARAIHPKEAPTVVTLNPPRAGATAAVLDQVALLQPRAIIYVSCNPETLARDIAYLRRLGYAARRAQPVDMFPQTTHVETVVLLESGKE